MSMENDQRGPGMGMSAIDKLLEQQAIERMMFEYSYALDMNQPDKLADLFVDDCEVSYAPNFGASGMEAYKKTLEGIGTFFRGTSHHNSNVVVDFVSDAEADVRSIVLAVHRYTKERPDGILYGQYFDTVVKRDGRWKFKRRELRTTMATDYHVRAANPIGRAE
jgi:ketosteroid isomerase-like protein